MTLTFDLEIWFKVTVHPLPDRYSEGHKMNTAVCNVDFMGYVHVHV